MVPLVRKYLGNEMLWCRVAEAGREEVVQNHTYEARVEKLLSVLREDAGRLWAPAQVAGASRGSPLFGLLRGQRPALAREQRVAARCAPQREWGSARRGFDCRGVVPEMAVGGICERER